MNWRILKSVFIAEAIFYRAGSSWFPLGWYWLFLWRLVEWLVFRRLVFGFFFVLFKFCFLFFFLLFFEFFFAFLVFVVDCRQDGLLFFERYFEMVKNIMPQSGRKMVVSLEIR